MHTPSILREEAARTVAEHWHGPSFDERSTAKTENAEAGNAWAEQAGEQGTPPRNEQPSDRPGSREEMTPMGDEHWRRRVLRGKAAQSVATPYKLDEVIEASPDVFAARVPDDVDGEADTDIEALKADWDAEWQARLDTAVEKARREGYEAGRVEAERAAAVQREQAWADTDRQIRQLQEALDAYMAACTPLLTDLAVDVAEAVLQGPLPPDARARMVEALHAAMDALGGDYPLTVTLHPVDYMHVQETGFIKQVEHALLNVTWRTDPEGHEGDWSVESPVAVVRQLRAEALDGLRQTLNVPNRFNTEPVCA